MGILNFRRFAIVPLVLAISFLSLQAEAQGGSAGGAGGGFGGGSSSGNFRNRQNEIFPSRQGDSIENAYLWNSQSMILTQGDKVEWKLSGKKGQTLFAFVTSDVFDAALSVVDPDGKVLVENDDQREGDQSPFISFHFPDDREYKITVKNYRSTAGGRFKLYSRFLPSIDLKMGDNLVSNETIQGLKDAERGGVLRLSCQKGQSYSVMKPRSVDGASVEYGSPWQLVGPTGVVSQDMFLYDSYNRDFVFEAKSTGDYYLIFTESPPVNSVIRVGQVNVIETTKDSQKKIAIKPFEFVVVKFPIEMGDILHRNYEFDGAYAVKTSFLPNKNDEETSPAALTDEQSFTYLPDQSKQLEKISLENQSGQLYVVANSVDQKGTSFKISTSTQMPSLPVGSPLNARLKIGQTDGYVLNGKKGDVFRMEGSADGLELTYTLFRVHAPPMVFIDRTKHVPNAILTLDQDMRFLVTISSAGQGGSGSYNLRTVKAEPKAVVLGKVEHGDPGEIVQNNFSIDLESTTYYLFTLEGKDTSILLLDEDGDEIPFVNQAQFDNTRTFSFKSEKKGKYRLRLFQAPKEVKFKIDKQVPPKLDGR